MPNVDLETVRSSVELLILARQKKKEFELLEKNAKAEIEQAMGGNSVGELDGHPIITINRYKKNQWQGKAFAEAHPELAAEFTALVTAQTLNVIKDEA